MEKMKLNNGIECPAVGIGTFMLSPADAENSVREALKMGYTLVDTENGQLSLSSFRSRRILTSHRKICAVHWINTVSD